MAFEWTIVDEIRLYRWVAEFKPAGTNKHFHMLCILERMNHPDKYPVILLQKEAVRPGKLFTAREIWDKLNMTYNLEEVDKLEDRDMEPASGSNGGEPETRLRERRRLLHEVRDFELPWDEYGELILQNARNGVDEETKDFIAQDSVAKKKAGERLGELAVPELDGSEREDSDAAGNKRRSTRIRQSQRLKRSRPGSDEELSSKESSDSEVHDLTDIKSKESSEEIQPKDEDSQPGDLPLAKRTRNSSQTRTGSETSPKRRKRSTDQPGPTPTVPTRVSSRLRNRRQ